MARNRRKHDDEGERIGPSDPPPPPELIPRLLAEGTIVACEGIPWGSNYSFAVAIEQEPHRVIAVYKPRRGEAPLWDFPDGTLYKREYGAYLVSQALGWDFIPHTTLRDGPYGVGSVQLYIEHDPKAPFQKFAEQYPVELRRIALFDHVANNADRKAYHCLRGLDNRLYGIDHGLCFNVTHKLRTVIWEFCGQPIPEDLLHDLRGLLEHRERRGALATQLRDLLDRDEVTAFFARLERVLQMRQFPALDPYRNIPRGFF